MAFAVQDDNGGVSGANAYLSVADFKTYHDDRAQSYGGADDASIQARLVIATGYLDKRFAFVGRRTLGRGQTTQWPRVDAYDQDRRLVVGIPREVKEACAEYALRALSAPLLPDPSSDFTGSRVKMKKEVLGPLEETTQYTDSALYQLPRYPAADNLLSSSGLLLTGGQLMRG